MPFSIVPLSSGVIRISLEGDLDVFTVEGLRSELASVARRNPTYVEVELSHLRSINKRGMEVILSFLESIARLGCRITVRGLRNQPLKTFKTALVDAILHASRPVN